jgi:hypothetical protein
VISRCGCVRVVALWGRGWYAQRARCLVSQSAEPVMRQPVARGDLGAGEPDAVSGPFV